MKPLGVWWPQFVHEEEVDDGSLLAAVPAAATLFLGRVPWLYAARCSMAGESVPPPLYKSAIAVLVLLPEPVRPLAAIMFDTEPKESDRILLYRALSVGFICCCCFCCCCCCRSVWAHRFLNESASRASTEFCSASMYVRHLAVREGPVLWMCPGLRGAGRESTGSILKHKGEN